jgi:hypothetical protein
MNNYIVNTDKEGNKVGGANKVPDGIFFFEKKVKNIKLLHEMMRLIVLQIAGSL